jgi:hypothetical protein
MLNNWANKKSFNRGEIPIPQETFLKTFLNITPFEENKAKRLLPKKVEKRELFERMLETSLSPSLSAKELIEKIVRAALEIEFGAAFTLSAGFDKMLTTIAEAVVTNSELRRQALAIASLYISKKANQNQ